MQRNQSGQMTIWSRDYRLKAVLRRDEAPPNPGKGLRASFIRLCAGRASERVGGGAVYEPADYLLGEINSVISAGGIVRFIGRDDGSGSPLRALFADPGAAAPFVLFPHEPIFEQAALHEDAIGAAIAEPWHLLRLLGTLDGNSGYRRMTDELRERGRRLLEQEFALWTAWISGRIFAAHVYEGGQLLFTQHGLFGTQQELAVAMSRLLADARSARQETAH